MIFLLLHNSEKEEVKVKKKYSILLLFLFAVFLIGGERVMAKEALKKPLGVMANGVENQVVISWEPVKNAGGYEVFEKSEGEIRFSKIKETTSCKVILKKRVRGRVYQYKVRAYQKKKNYGKFSVIVETTVAKNSTSTIKNFLTTALAPVGSTMYIWGGGWNKADTGAGKDGLRIGLNPNWRNFCNKQKASYNYRNHRFQFGAGLDCSGFVGWSVYNIKKTKNGKSGGGYVTKSSKVAASYAKYGWGTYKKAAYIKDWKAGDIMSSSSHVYIVIGNCPDGSVVLVHSSPTGVRLSGTPDKKGRANSEAVQLAKKYMKKYYPSWYKKYPSCRKGMSYLTDFNQFRWKVGKGKMMSDPDGYETKSAEAILNDLYCKK